MAFPRDEVAKLLVACHRRCCICHRFCGFKMETDHIVPRGEGGPDDISNAIPVCFECHAEIHLYNPAHPRGRKYTPDELRAHRDQWLDLCRTSAQFLASVPVRVDVGPLQGMIDELEFAQSIIGLPDRDVGCPLSSTRFDDALANGGISLMPDNLKTEVYRAYAAIKRADAFVRAVPGFDHGSNAWAMAHNRARDAMKEAAPNIDAALQALREHLSQEA